MLAEVTSPRHTYRLDPASRRMGGQAEVFRATGPDGAVVAVRIALVGGSGGAWLPEETARVRDLLARHADADGWIVPVLDGGATADGRPFGVHPWFDDTLATWIERADPPLSQRLDALVAAAGAVVRLHHSPAELDRVLLHRDLKPDNFLVTPGPGGVRVLLGDLGIGKDGRLFDATTNTGRYTPRYAPPEQTLPVERPPDPSVDVYALAMTVYVCLCGRLPQAAVAQDGRFTEAARRLVTLDRARRRTAEEEAEWRALRRAPIGDLVDLEGPGLLPVDQARLFNTVLEGGVDGDAATRLVDLVRSALEADPGRRLADPRRLYGALRETRRALGGEVGQGAGEGAGAAGERGAGEAPAVAPTAVPTLAGPEETVIVAVPSPRARPLLWVGGGIAAGLGALALVGTGFFVSRAVPGDRDGDGAGPAAAVVGAIEGDAEAAVRGADGEPAPAGPLSPATEPEGPPVAGGPPAGAVREAAPPGTSAPLAQAGAPTPEVPATPSTPPRQPARAARPSAPPAGGRAGVEPAPGAVDPAARAPSPAAPVARPRVSVTRLADADATFTLDGAPLARAGMPVALADGSHTFTWTARGRVERVTVDLATDGAAWTIQASDGATKARITDVAPGATLRMELDGAGALQILR